ncbi:MAG: MFS transporter [Ktedonobacteraceae bacterium]|nr:MFS transporter [Ktedonobacteraceae bacterium]
MDETTSSVSEGAELPRHTFASYARYAFIIMFGISFLNYLDRYVLSGAANAIAQDLNFDLGQVGIITSAFLVVYTLAALPIGVWADRTKRKNVVALCVTIWSVATAATALATNFATLFISRMVLGIGEAGYFPAGTALLSDYFERAKRSRIMSWWSGAQMFGILGGFGLGGAIAGISTGSWRWAFVFTGIPGLLFAYLAWRIREPRRNQADEEVWERGEQETAIAQDGAEIFPLSVAGSVSEQRHSRHLLSQFLVWLRNLLSQFLVLLRIKTLVVLTIMQIFAFFVLGVNAFFLPIYLQQKDTFGMSSAFAGIYSGVVIVVAGFAGILLGGYLADAINRRHPGARVLVCGIGFLLGAPAFALAVTYHDIVVFTVCFTLTVLLLMMYNGPSLAATQDITPSVLRASAVALSLFIAHLLGDAFSPSIVGLLATAFDPTHGLHFKAGMAGLDLSNALLVTCTPALGIAGLVGIVGSRWMASDVAAAERADRADRAAKEAAL